MFHILNWKTTNSSNINIFSKMFHVIHPLRYMGEPKQTKQSLSHFFIPEELHFSYQNYILYEFQKINHEQE